MKSYFTILILFVTLLGFNEACAQKHGASGRSGAGPGPGPGPGPFNEYRKMKLIETLKLNEEDAARFVAKSTAHEDAVHKLMAQRGDLLDDIRKALKENKDVKEYQKSVDQVSDLDQQIFKERQRFQEEMRKFLSPEKYARFVVFESELGRGVRDVLKDMIHEHWRERGE
jgi:Spy/CpxP family protein refolding chaperone